MNRKTLGCLFMVLVFTAGCAASGSVYQSSPKLQGTGTASFEATLEPLRAEGYDYYNSFRFGFTNKTDKDLVIVWSESYYLHNPQ